MPITTDELEDLTLALAREHTSEAHRRCAISRAYLTAYHLVQPAQAHLLPPHTPPSGEDDPLIHNLLHGHAPHAGETARRRLRRLGYMLKRLRAHQHTADYAPTEPVTQAHVQHALQILQAIEQALDEAESLLPEPPPGRRY
ncbi:MAG: hypothetical protein ACLFSI_08545 [Halorhodospira sp.]